MPRGPGNPYSSYDDGHGNKVLGSMYESINQSIVLAAKGQGQQLTLRAGVQPFSQVLTYKLGGIAKLQEPAPPADTPEPPPLVADLSGKRVLTE